MSRFLAAFRASVAPAEKTRFSRCIVPNKSKKANNPKPATPGGGEGEQNTDERGFSPFSDFSAPYPPKNAFFDATPETASDAAFDAAERAAIIAESEHGNAPAPVPHRLPPSWADASIIPTPGARCHCCKGARWWCEAVKPTGWRCAVCHPPGGLPVANVREAIT